MNSFAAVVGGRPPFTATQWQELEHQALILKYLMAGVPVPPELIIPIRRSFETLPGRYYHPSLSYYSYYGKKPDPEPGRCRRTDGKKWRCSKDAYPGSKYCERHMHRGRNRSRKPVESQTVAPSQTSSSALTSLSPSVSNASGTGVGSFRGITLQPITGPSNAQSLCFGGASSSQLPMDTGTFGNRYFSGLKPDADEHSFFSGASGTARALGVDSSLDSSWRPMPPPVSSFSLSKTHDLSILQNAYPQLQSVQDLGQVTINSLSRQQQQHHSFFGSEFGSSEPVKHETQLLRPFFDEWPKTRDSWSDLEEDRSNRTSFSTTQLSISIPIASSDFSSTSSRSPNGGSPS
ncbi:growth-regulating factor 5 isoform X1 [Musa acuminata AAA Group]|uniref:growth-regulating factor 5 isoform X1 n=1 Tax=Musa acuminata AAA Group TaxID=214697 RepID=UPI0031DD1CCC